MPDRGSRKPGRAGRPIAAPPASLGLAEPFPGFSVLDECRSPTGVILWQTVRDVVLWASTPADRRDVVFARGSYGKRLAGLRAAGLQEGVRAWLMLLGDVLNPDDQPGREIVALTCRKVARWAEEHVLPRTAVWFAQAAALSLPESADQACAVAVICRRSGEHVRAEMWFRRAIGLARRRHDAAAYARAYLGLGNLFIKRNDHDRAHLAFLRAYRTARRAGIREITAEALHDLFVVTAETQRVGEAEAYAHKAHRTYPRTHPNRVMLARDVAAFWVLQGRYECALPALQALTGVLDRPADKLFAVSNLARAAGAVGDRQTYVNAWVDTWRITDAQPTLECVTSSLLRLAYGAAHLEDWERVDLAARTAFDLAAKRGEEVVRQECASLLHAAETHQFTETPPLSSPADSATMDAADALAREMVASLTACAGGNSDPRMWC